MKAYGVKRHWNAAEDYGERFRRTHCKWVKIGHRAARRTAKLAVKKQAARRYDNAHVDG